MSACLFPSSLSDLIRQSKRSLFITVMFRRSVGSSSGEAASRLRCSLVGERSSDSENHEAYKTNSGNTLSMCPGHPWIPGACCACPRMTKKIQGSASATACALQQRLGHSNSLRSRASPCQAGNSLSYAGLTGETIKNVWIRWYFFGLPYFAG